MFSLKIVVLYSWREEFGFEYYFGTEHGIMMFIVNQTFRATVVELCEQRQVGLFMDAPTLSILGLFMLWRGTSHRRFGGNGVSNSVHDKCLMTVPCCRQS